MMGQFRKYYRADMKFVSAAWLLILIAWVSTTSEATPHLGMNISMGLYKQSLPSPVFYEAFVPIIYEYTVPRYSALDITLRDWREKCRTDNFAPSYTCPVFFHYEKFLERFQSEVVPRAWTSKGTGDGSNLPSIPKMGNDFCNNIQQHFPGAITQQFGFEEYIEKLQKCPLGEMIIKRGINDYVFNIKQMFKSMNKNYENEFSNSFLGAASSKLSPAFYVNAVTTHQNGMLVAYLLEKDRWSQAELSCNAQLIPKALVRNDNLTSSLTQLRQVLKAHNLDSSINPNETSAFYKVPITDCSYIETTGNFVVRIQIPVLKKALAPSLYKLESVPFVFDDDKGSGGSRRQLCQIRTDPKTYIFDQTSGILQESKCNPNSPLCKLNNFVSSDVVSPCVSSVFSGSMEGVKKYCEMDCIPWKDIKDGLKMLPSFHQVKDDTWLVTGNPLSGVALKCQGKQDKILEQPEIGALEITLPCSCYLAYHTDSYYPQSSCKDDVEPVVKHILPVHFIRDDKLDELQRITLSSGGNAEDGTNNNSIDEPTYVVSSFVGKSYEGFGGAQSSPHVSENSEGSGNNGSLTFLWVVFVIQLIGFITMAAVLVYKYVERRRKLGAFSKERLVYNVYPSASNPNYSSSTPSTTDTYPYVESQRSSIVENNLNII
ncbi:unnamed protein product [Orchesella dallaii]|uniref:Uncharacterized protein n=1 Tax=Orchesella dallaii TaxID=48710 RepID=A0ABP1RCE0_9HEXA